MFLVNIMRYTVDVADGSFSKPSSAEARRELDSVIRYLQSRNISVSLDDGAQAAVAARQSSGTEIRVAREAGWSLHKSPQTSPINTPGFQRTLKDYQVPAVAHLLAVRHAANFSVPGSGKTTMVLAAYAALKAAGEIDQLVVIGPRSCFAPWEEEFKECFGRKPNAVRLTGTPIERTELYSRVRSSETDFALVTYATASNDSEALAALFQDKKVLLVLDESHYIKRLIGGLWAATVRDLAPLAERRVVLSGTPVPNGILDIWSQMTFLWPDPPLLGTRERFQDRVQRGGDDIAHEIRDELLPFFWRVKKSDVALPPPRFHRISVQMRPYQLAIYRALGAKVLADVVSQPTEREKLRKWRTAKMVRLLQAASNPTLLSQRTPEFKLPPLNAAGLGVSEIIGRYSEYETPAKFEAAVELAKQLVEAGEKVVIWSSFVHNLTMLEASLNAYAPLVVHGQVPRDASEDMDFNRERLIEQFKTNDGHPILIANPGACAESISLHRVCKHAIYLDRSFNGAQYMQSLDRIHRLGLGPNDKVHYYLFSTADTVDEVVDSRLEAKHKRLIELLEGDLTTVDLDDTSMSEPAEEAADFAAMVAQLRTQFSGNILS